MKIINKIKQIEKYICENFEDWDLSANQRRTACLLTISTRCQIQSTP